MNYGELKQSVDDINEEIGMCYYEVMLALDICDLLLIESNVEEISDELFDEICGCVKTGNWNSDEFSENSRAIMFDVQESSVEEIKFDDY